MVEIDCCDRWEAYFRLQQLEIACDCESYQPLKVRVSSANDAIQVWCLTYRLTKSRLEQVQWLEGCFMLG